MWKTRRKWRWERLHQSTAQTTDGENFCKQTELGTQTTELSDRVQTPGAEKTKRFQISKRPVWVQLADTIIQHTHYCFHFDKWTVCHQLDHQLQWWSPQRRELPVSALFLPDDAGLNKGPPANTNTGGRGASRSLYFWSVVGPAENLKHAPNPEIVWRENPTGPKVWRFTLF